MKESKQIQSKKNRRNDKEINEREYRTVFSLDKPIYHVYFNTLEVEHFLYCSDTVVHAAGWSSNLQGDD